MGLAHATGAVARKVGDTGRDLQPEHRRDGIGLLLVALAVVVAAREWWGMPGAVGTIVHAVVAGTFGKVGYAVPLVLLAFGIRMLRTPQDEAATSRAAVGTIALAFAACGLTHVAAGVPTPPEGADGMRAAGGILGFLSSSPLEAAVSVYGAVPLLLLLALFGLLVITATPLHQVPTRLRALVDRLTGHLTPPTGPTPPIRRPASGAPAGAVLSTTRVRGSATRRSSRPRSSTRSPASGSARARSGPLRPRRSRAKVARPPPSADRQRGVPSRSGCRWSRRRPRRCRSASNSSRSRAT